MALNFDDSAFHSLFPDAELAIVRIPKPPDRASPGEIASCREPPRQFKHLRVLIMEEDGEHGPGEYVWDTTHLGFSTWSERRRVRLSYQYFQHLRQL